VKVKKPSRQTLTTQLYFPDQPHNAADGIFRSECVIELAPDGRTARFDFVLPW
jgi:protocatechuate 3,4-dioxygenase beta subunit